MPSSKKYKANRKSHYKHEEKRRKINQRTKGDPKASKPKVERAKLRKKLGLKVGDKATAGHTGKGKLSNRLSGKRKGPLKGRKQSAKSNYGAGGASVRGKKKAVAKKGRGYAGRKKSA